MSRSDTIYAVATAQGRAGVAVLRVSGAQAFEVLRAICRIEAPEPRKAVFCRFYHPQTQVLIDEGLVLAFAAPASFTGEHVLELHTHGSRAVLKAMLASLSAIDGLRPAEPGEFARRAFLNGKMTLYEAEGLADLIDSETEQQRQYAIEQVAGGSAEALERWRQRLLDARALIEAELDFPDEEDVPGSLLTPALDDVRRLRAELEEALEGSKRAQRLREGYSVVLAGEPNAGKSSLMNALVRRDVAIVSAQPGTTRDTLEAYLDLQGIPVVFVDTAGVRSTDDGIESQGIERALKRASQADLVLWLQPTDCVPQAARPDFSGVATWVVMTKSDLPAVSDFPHDHCVSAQTGLGLGALLDSVAEYFSDQNNHLPQVVLSMERQRRAVSLALQALKDFESHAQDQPLEILAEHLRRASDALSFLVGRMGVEEILGTIFGRFCIGK